MCQDFSLKAPASGMVIDWEAGIAKGWLRKVSVQTSFRPSGV